MNNYKVTSILASYVTLKSLYDTESYRSPYQVLAEFIKCVIFKNKLYTFSSCEIKDMLKETFEFDIPEAVVKTALRRAPFVTAREHAFAIVNTTGEDDKFFMEKCDAAQESEAEIINKLAMFVSKHNKSLSTEATVLRHKLVEYLVNDTQTVDEYSKIIGQFILEYKDNDRIQNILNAVREGGVLYIGLNYNINETGSLKKPLTIYLATEMLFSLYGFNGAIYKQFAEDFYEQVKKANTKEHKIYLKYFGETKKEIDSFFKCAELLVKKKMPYIEDKTAMKNIINGCSLGSDVIVKKAQFYNTMQSTYNITEDTENYYRQELSQYNLEDLSHDATEFDAMKFISNINKLRQGKIYTNTIQSEYIFVTNSRDILSLSKKQSERDRIEHSVGLEENTTLCGYAVSLTEITNTLWYKLLSGFGKIDYPKNVNAILLTRTLLHAQCTHNISKLYEEVNRRYKLEEISKDELESCIVCLKEASNSITPENLSVDSVDEVCGLTYETVSRYDEKVRTMSIELEKTKRELADKEKIREKEKKDSMFKISELARYKQRDCEDWRKEQYRDIRVRLLIKLAAYVIGSAICICLLDLLFNVVCKLIGYNFNSFSIVSIVVEYVVMTIFAFLLKLPGKVGKNYSTAKEKIETEYENRVKNI